MSKPNKTCRTCKFLIVRWSFNGGNSYYCDFAGDDADHVAVDDWRFDNKPDRALPVKGARNCPGHSKKDPS